MARIVTETGEPSALSRWTSRIAIFSVVLLFAAFILHRLFGMPTPIAINIVGLAYLGALISFLIGSIAAGGIWINGGSGTARIVSGVLIGLLMIGGALALLALAAEHPPINDITTDFADPPAFTDLVKERGAYANAPQYPGAAFAEIQTHAFPDITTMHIDRNADETFALVIDAATRQKMMIIRSTAPGEGDTEEGSLEAVDRTLVFGFYDDVAVRVRPDGDRARVDIRSASRYGRYDYGRNAERVRALMHEIIGRVQSSVPAVGETAKDKKKQQKPGAKQGKDGDPKSEGRRKSRDHAQ